MGHPDPKGTLVVASVSGGKDSTAMSLWLTEQGIEHRRVFADTGWEHPATEEYVREYLPKVLGPIDTVSSDKYDGMEGLCRHKGAFPSRLMRFCTQELKVKPIIRYLTAIDEEYINAVGIRAGESAARAKMTEWEWQERGFDCWVWRPLIQWSEQDVIDIHTRHGVRPNPLYLQGARRVGCWPCIFARKEEVQLVSNITPERIDRIRSLEHDVQAAAQARNEAKGETFESRGHHPPTFFHSKGRTMTPVPIDEYVDWARTTRGGRQYALFGPEDMQDGCMRWGLCDTDGDE